MPPAPPQDCRISNGSADALRVRCRPGFDGGLPQTFLLEVKRANYVSDEDGAGGSLLSRSRASRPDFVFSGLVPGTEYSIEVSAVNAKGRSKAVRLMARTMMRVAGRRVQGGGDTTFSYGAGKTLSLLFRSFPSRPSLHHA